MLSSNFIIKNLDQINCFHFSPTILLLGIGGRRDLLRSKPTKGKDKIEISLVSNCQLCPLKDKLQVSIFT